MGSVVDTEKETEREKNIESITEIRRGSERQKERAIQAKNGPGVI